MEEVRLFIIDDDEMQIWIIRRYFRNDDIIKIKYTATDGEEGLRLLEKEYKNIDVLILDLMMPVHDGLYVLSELIRRNIDVNTIVISSTNLSNESYKLGIKYFFTKPIDLEKFRIKLIELKKLKTIKDIDSFIVDILHTLGMPSNIKGYYYIKEAISLIIKNEYNNYSKELYPIIADKYNTTVSNVEKSIRVAIEISMLRSDIKVIQNIFGNSINYDKSKPTNKEFLNTLSEKVKVL